MREQLRTYRALVVTLILTVIVAVALFVQFLHLELARIEANFNESVALAAARGDTHLSLLIERLETLGHAYLLLGADDWQLRYLMRTRHLKGTIETLCIHESNRSRALHASKTAESTRAVSSVTGRCASDAMATTPALALTSGEGIVTGEVRLVDAVGGRGARALGLQVHAGGERRLSAVVPAASLLETMLIELAAHRKTAGSVCFSLLVDGVFERLDCRRDGSNGRVPATAPAGEFSNRLTQTVETAGLVWRVSAEPDRRRLAVEATPRPFIMLAATLVVGTLIALFTYSVIERNLRLEQKTREQRRLLGRLESQNRELDQFATMAAHDLQAPLRFMVANTHLLDMELDGLDRPDLSGLCATVIEQGNRMRELMIDLLEFCRAGQNALTYASVDMHALVAEEVRMVITCEEYAHTHVTIDTLPRALPGDPSKLRQVVRNLLGNAAKFSCRDPHPIISVRASHTDGDRHWTFRVEDNGPGVSAEHHTRIFLPFNRLDPSIKGTGMGLAIAGKLLERHGGTLWIDPHFTGGSAFCFTLPEEPLPDVSLQAPSELPDAA